MKRIVRWFIYPVIRSLTWVIVYYLDCVKNTKKIKFNNDYGIYEHDIGNQLVYSFDKYFDIEHIHTKLHLINHVCIVVTCEDHNDYIINEDVTNIFKKCIKYIHIHDDKIDIQSDMIWSILLDQIDTKLDKTIQYYLLVYMNGKTCNVEKRKIPIPKQI